MTHIRISFRKSLSAAGCWTFEEKESLLRWLFQRARQKQLTGFSCLPSESEMLVSELRTKLYEIGADVVDEP
jgi:hypothetical protein